LTPVRKVQSQSTINSIVIEFDILPTSRLNGLDVLSYSLEIDYNLNGNFKPVTGLQMNQLTLTYIEYNVNKGNTIACRYRARNIYGWSDYSPISYLTVAVQPA
jgi:hypothetical protein